MRVSALVPRIAPAAVLLALTPAAAPATTLERRSVDQLAAASEVIVIGRVLELHSYWNGTGDFILTDVHLRTTHVLKGSAGADVRFTLPGGSVGDRTVLVLGGAELVPGSEYALFLAHGDLPGAPARLTVREHAQGAFDVAEGRALSQAIRFGLAPDAAGNASPPGGSGGLSVAEFARLVRGHVDH